MQINLSNPRIAEFYWEEGGVRYPLQNLLLSISKVGGTEQQWSKPWNSPPYLINDTGAFTFFIDYGYTAKLSLYFTNPTRVVPLSISWQIDLRGLLNKETEILPSVDGVQNLATNQTVIVREVGVVEPEPLVTVELLPKLEFMLKLDSVTLQYYETMSALIRYEDGTTELFYATIKNDKFISFQLKKPPMLNNRPVFGIYKKGTSVIVEWVMMWQDFVDSANDWRSQTLLVSGNYSATYVTEHPRYARLISHPPQASRGETITITVDWKTDIDAYLAVMVREPPGFTTYKSATSTVQKLPGRYSERLTFQIDPNNITGDNKIDVQVVG